MKALENVKYLIGIDEAGRGPLAGPVAVGAFVFLTPEAKKKFRGVKESKQLTEEERESWFALIEKVRNEGHVNYSVTFSSENIIDNKGLTYAIRQALETSLNELKIISKQAVVLLDGGLKAPARFRNQKTIIRGDEKRIVIALASICAKVTRDRFMRQMSLVHPEYGFDHNKGYGTIQHYRAIQSYGVLPIHRKSFLNKKLPFGQLS